MGCGPLPRIGIPALLGLLTGPARADDPPSDDALVTTAARAAEQRQDTDRSIALVSAQDLGEATPRSTPEALLDSPGAWVVHSHHGGGSAVLRGMVGPRVQLRFDGVRIGHSAQRSGPGHQLNLLEPLLLQRVELLRGPSSTLHGQGAMGGVIQAFPQGPRDYRDQDSPAAHGDMKLRYAHADRGKTAAGRFEAGLRGFGVGGGVTYKVLGDLHAGGQTDLQPHSGYTQPSALVIAEHRFDGGALDGWRMRAGYSYADIREAGRTDGLQERSQLMVYDDTLHIGWARLDFELGSTGIQGRATGSWQHASEVVDSLEVDAQLDPTGAGTRDRLQVGTTGADVQLSRLQLDDRLEALAGAELYRDNVSSWFFQRDTGDAAWNQAHNLGLFDGSTHIDWGGFLVGRARLLPSSGDHQLEASAGLRYGGATAHAPAQGYPYDVDSSHAGLTVQAALQHRIAERASTSLSFAQGLRGPSLHETARLGDGGAWFVMPTGALEPERADTLELAHRHALGRFSGELAIHHTWLRDPIELMETSWTGAPNADGQIVVQHVNGDDRKLWGGDAGLGFDMGRGLSTSTWVSLLRDPGPQVIQPNLLVPPLFGTWSLRYDAYDKKLRAFVEGWAHAAAPHDDATGWWTLNFRMGMGVYKRTRLTLGVENLLNAEVQPYGSGLYLPGTNLSAALEASF